MNVAELGITAKNDGLTMIVGKIIGAGVSRTVFEYLPNPTDTVLKVETNVCFQNVREWLVWQAVRESKDIAAWFAPCIRISDYGGWLMQERTKPVTLEELKREVPVVPQFFTDLKVGNWGRLGKRIVCHDYGSCLVTERGLTTRKRIAQWWV